MEDGWVKVTGWVFFFFFFFFRRMFFCACVSRWVGESFDTCDSYLKFFSPRVFGIIIYLLTKQACFFPFNCLVFKKLKNILIFHFPFLQFWFPCLNFFFFQKGNINIDSIKLLNDFEISVLKIKCVKNVFWIFNFFEMTLKILKTMQIHQKYTFLRFFVVFFYFYFSKK
jgi:hypothetical protein